MNRRLGRRLQGARSLGGGGRLDVVHPAVLDESL
jgi:hypothetical protein